MSMEPTIKAQWLAALRSGDYTQGTKTLNKNNTFCCLGVLCDLAVKAGVTSAWASEAVNEWDDYYVFYGSNDRSWTSFLPEEVESWAKITNNGELPTPVAAPVIVPHLPDTIYTLTDANDRGLTFAEIADIIEEQF